MSETCLDSNAHKHGSSLEMTLFNQSGKRYQNLWKVYSSRVKPVTWVLTLNELQEKTLGLKNPRE